MPFCRVFRFPHTLSNDIQPYNPFPTNHFSHTCHLFVNTGILCRLYRYASEYQKMSNELYSSKDTNDSHFLFIVYYIFEEKNCKLCRKKGKVCSFMKIHRQLKSQKTINIFCQFSVGLVNLFFFVLLFIHLVLIYPFDQCRITVILSNQSLKLFK